MVFMAALTRSAADPCTAVLIACLSAAARACGLAPAVILGRYRLRPHSVFTYPRVLRVVSIFNHLASVMRHCRFSFIFQGQPNHLLKIKK